MTRILIALSICCILTTACFGEFEAITKARHDLRLGFTVPGKVLVRHVQPGDTVKKGDLLIELEDKEGLAQIEIWKFRATSLVEVTQAKASLELAEIEESRTRELVAKHAAVPFELKKAELTTAVQKLSVEKANRELEEAKRQLQITQARHDSYTLRPPDCEVTGRRIAVCNAVHVEHRSWNTPADAVGSQLVPTTKKESVRWAVTMQLCHRCQARRRHRRAAAPAARPSPAGRPRGWS